MPIRFRCDYCGQLLSIASRKAGSAVRCPKCRHENSVPTESARGATRKEAARFFESSRFDEWIGRLSEEGTSEVDSASVKSASTLDVPTALGSTDVPRRRPVPALRPIAPRESDSTSAEPWRRDPEKLPEQAMSEGESEGGSVSSHDASPAPISIWSIIGGSLLAVFFLLIAFSLGIMVGRYGFPAR
jgi:phage FluMu protein Com